MTSNVKISDLTPDEQNANKGTERGLKALDRSLRQYGAGRSILLDRDGRIIAGNKTAERAADIGIDDVVIVETDGTKLVAVKRTDLDLEDDGGKARALATYDNRVGQLDLDWDIDALSVVDSDVLASLWTDEELSELTGIDNKNNYSRNIKAPIYEPKGKKPEIKDLYNDTRTKDLIAEIDRSQLPEDEKEFLRIAANRHTVFNYKRIAEYYSHSNEDTQALMENSALVIIDFDRAIELGYVKLSERVAKQYLEDYSNAR